MKTNQRNENFCFQCNTKLANERDFKSHKCTEYISDKKNDCESCHFEPKSIRGLINHMNGDYTTDVVTEGNNCNFKDRSNKEIEEHIRIKHVPQVINDLEEKISSIEAEENRKQILNNFKYFSENPESIQMSRMWKLLKRIWPKFNSQSTAKKNHKGDIISNPNAFEVCFKLIKVLCFK